MTRSSTEYGLRRARHRLAPTKGREGAFESEARNPAKLPRHGIFVGAARWAARKGKPAIRRYRLFEAVLRNLGLADEAPPRPYEKPGWSIWFGGEEPCALNTDTGRS